VKEVTMRITRLPYKIPKDEARISAILIGRGVVALVIGFKFPGYLVANTFGKDSPMMTVMVAVMMVIILAGQLMLLAGTGLGYHALYRLTRSREPWGYAWVSIIALPLAALLILL
jgi:hypothetical protein